MAEDHEKEDDLGRPTLFKQGFHQLTNMSVVNISKRSHSQGLSASLRACAKVAK